MGKAEFERIASKIQNASHELTNSLRDLTSEVGREGYNPLNDPFYVLRETAEEIYQLAAKLPSDDEINKREEEKKLLVLLSTEVAAVRNKREFLHVFNTKIKAFFPITGFGITLLNKDQITHSPFLIDAYDAVTRSSDLIKLSAQRFAANDGVFNVIIISEQPVILEVDKLISAKEVPPYVVFWNKKGINRVLGVPLRSGDRPLGCLIFHLDADSANTARTHLLQGVCAQIAVTISNIIINEEIGQQEEEKTILLSLTNEIAAVRTRNELFQVVNDKLKAVFFVKEFGIAQIDQDRSTYSAFIIDLEESAKNLPDFEEVTSRRYNITDPVFSRIMHSEDPVLFQLNEIAGQPGIPAYIQFWRKIGLEQVLCIALRVAGTNIGCVFLHLESDSMSKLQTGLLKGVCAQLSVAVSNILAIEDIAGREKERALLLSLNTDISAVRNNDELLQVIVTRLKNLLSFNHTLIAIINNDKTSVRVFLSDHESPSRNHPKYEDALKTSYSINDGFMNKALMNSAPILFEVDSLEQDEDVPLYLKINIETGVRQFIIIRFSKGEELFGFWMIFFDNKNGFNTKYTSLIEGLANQMSIAVANIVANKNIQHREQEKSRLLAFSNAMASVRDKFTLGKILKKQFQELFKIEEYTIHALSADKQVYSPVLFDNHAEFAEFPGFIDMINSKSDVNDGVCNVILESEEPVTFNVDDWFLLPKVPEYAKMTADMGIKKVTGFRIRLGQENIGFLKFKQTDNTEFAIQQPLFKSICSQIAISLSNIIANDEIHGREQEKSRLLEFSNSLASVRDKKVLGKILTHQLHDLFKVRDGYMIYALSKDHQTYYPVLFDPDSGFPSHPGFDELMKSKRNIKDGILEKILISDYPVTFKVEERYHAPIPLWYLELAEKNGIKNLTGFPIKRGQEKIGVIVFSLIHPLLEVQVPFFRSICSQIAIAVSNIIADNEIKQREEEKSRLLAFSNAIASVRERDVFARVLSKQLADLFGIREYAIHVLSEDKKTHRPIFYDPGAEFSKHPIFQTLVSQDTDVNDGIFNRILDSEEPITFDAPTWVELPNPPLYATAAIDIALKKLTGMRVRVGDENIAVWNFRNDNMDLTPEQYPILKSICSQIAVAISNILSNEKVLSQLKEINKYKFQLEEEKIYLKEEIETSHNFSEMIGESLEMKKVFRLVTQVASSDSTVLLLGETGTGKELIARAIHNSSPRKNKLMVKVNCAALPVNLIESELFGHERGSFTGATERRIGKFELANHGTLFLDEIGEMPLELQVKLLRALQEKEIERVGGSTTIKTDVRIIAATNRDLQKLMDEGKFRSDLYYRLNIFPISLPPLRKRKDDVPRLASHFILRFAKKSGKSINNLSSKALEELMKYEWPGNIRELEHVIERSVLLAAGDMIKEIYLPSHKINSVTDISSGPVPIKTIDDNERDHILQVLKHVKGRISGEGGAAELLGIPPSTLNSKMKRLGITKGHVG